MVVQGFLCWCLGQFQKIWASHWNHEPFTDTNPTNPYCLNPQKRRHVFQGGHLAKLRSSILTPLIALNLQRESLDSSPLADRNLGGNMVNSSVGWGCDWTLYTGNGVSKEHNLFLRWLFKSVFWTTSRISQKYLLRCVYCNLLEAT